jgi:hypothetical protein
MWARTAESLMLVAAIALLIPSPPSDPGPIAFMPIGAASTLLFLGSRLLRHGLRPYRSWLPALVEAALFFVVAYLLNESANILLNTQPSIP